MGEWDTPRGPSLGQVFLYILCVSLAVTVAILGKALIEARGDVASLKGSAVVPEPSHGTPARPEPKDQAQNDNSDREKVALLISLQAARIEDLEQELRGARTVRPASANVQASRRGTKRETQDNVALREKIGELRSSLRGSEKIAQDAQARYAELAQEYTLVSGRLEDAIIVIRAMRERKRITLPMWLRKAIR